MAKKSSKKNSKEIPRKKTKKSAKKTKEYQKKALSIKKKRQLVNISLTAVLILIILMGTSVIFLNTVEINEESPVFLQKLKEFNDRLLPGEIEYAAVVNQEPITMDLLNERYELIPIEYTQFIGKKELLEQLIDEILILQKAEELGIVITDEIVDEYILNLSISAGTSLEQFEVLLEQNGLTLDEAKEFYKKTLTLNELLEREIFTNVFISYTDIEDYYKENSEYFITPESIEVSHILVCHEQSERCYVNRTKEEALTRAYEIIGMVEENNFGELALNYSDEPAAQVTQGSLDWISRDMPFDETFLDAAFAVEPGDVSEPVETMFGYHIIKVSDKKPEEKLEFDSVAPQINQTLISQEQTSLFLEYVSELRNESDVIVFFEE